MKSLAWGLVGALLFCAPGFGQKMAAAVKSVGGVKIGKAGDPARRDLKAADIIFAGDRVEAGDGGRAVVRFFLDKTFMEIRPKSVLDFRLSTSGGKDVRNILLQIGEISLGVKKGGVPFTVETATAVASVRGTRWTISSSDEGTVVVVTEGEVSVQNRKTGKIVLVGPNQKAIVTVDELRIVAATPQDLMESVPEQALSIGFEDPATGEVNTLEIEYEGK